MMKFRNRKGFTLVEIMIVVAIIGLLAAIAIPNFANARITAARNACRANLRQIQGAIVAYQVDTGSDPASANITGAYVRSWPREPLNGNYSIAGTGANCNITCDQSASPNFHTI